MRKKNTLDIDPAGGPADRAAVQAYRGELLRLARMAPVRPTRVWLAQALQTTRNRLYRVLDTLGIKSEYETALRNWSVEKCHTQDTKKSE
jgi:hypothetical protein